MKIKETELEELIQEAFAFYNGGEGLDHWSYSSTSSPFSKNIINYSFSQKIRRDFVFRYKPSFGNLVNNTVQRLIADTIWTSEKSVIAEWDRDYQLNFDNELKQIKDKPPVDAKDEFAREEMLDYAHNCIGVTKKVVQDIVGDQKLECERYVEHKEMTMIKPIIGRIDYETDGNKKLFIELKTKPPNIRKVKNKEEWKMSSQAIPTEPTFENLTQTSFYFMCTKKIPFLVYVNDKEHIVFDQSHDLMKADHLEHLYFKMCEKILFWEKMIMYCKGNIQELAMMCEAPDLSHPFYYKDLAPEQLQLITNLWGMKHD
jgi:hypothetical protein